MIDSWSDLLYSYSAVSVVCLFPVWVLGCPCGEEVILCFAFALLPIYPSSRLSIGVRRDWRVQMGTEDSTI